MIKEFLDKPMVRGIRFRALVDSLLGSKVHAYLYRGVSICWSEEEDQTGKCEIISFAPIRLTKAAEYQINYIVNRMIDVFGPADDQWVSGRITYYLYNKREA